jgi:hypothetical protein
MVSIGVETSSMFGFDNPNNSQRIFGLYDGRTLFLPGLPPLHPPEIFMCDSFCHAAGSRGDFPFSADPGSRHFVRANCPFWPVSTIGRAHEGAV